MSSPKGRARIISPDAKDVTGPTSSNAPIKRSATAGAFVSTQAPTPNALEQLDKNSILNTEGGVLDLELLESAVDVTSVELGTWTTTASTTRAECAKLIGAWFQGDALGQSYALGHKDGETKEDAWVDLKMNAYSFRDQIQELFTPGSVFFDFEAAFNSTGATMAQGWYMRRLFLNAKRGAIEGPTVFLRQCPGQEFVEHSMVCSCLDSLLAISVLESFGAFTAWLSVTPVAPLPVNTTVLAKIVISDAPEEPGKKTKAKKLMASMEIVHPTQEDLVYIRGEGLFVRPAVGGFDTRRFLAYGPVVDSRLAWGMEEWKARAEEVLTGKLEEAGEAGLENLEKVKVQRAHALALLKDENEKVLVRVPDPEEVEARWLESDPIFRRHPELLAAPAAHMKTGFEYLTGGVLFRYSHAPMMPSKRHEKALADLAKDDDGTVCVTGAVHFLPSVEGPPGTAHGGSIYGVFNNLFRQALASPTLQALMVMSKDHGDYQPVPKVQYKGQVPLNGTYRLECRACVGAGGKGLILRGTLTCIEGKTVYDTAEAIIPAGLFFPDRSRL